ncbi:MAG TPA: serpin family protein [Bacteroidales bacterium]|nr:serpin family protein [Bacteroidales bacterium]
MRKPGITIFFLIFIAISIIGWACHRNLSRNKTPAGLPTQHTLDLSISQRNNMFAIDLLKSFDENSENIVLSPFSVSSAMALAYAGAAGTTKDEMAKVLRFYPRQIKFHRSFSKLQQSVLAGAKDGIQLNIANNLWLQEGYHFRKRFINLLEKHYQIDVKQADFSGGDREAIRQEINQWAFEKTHENVADLIAPGVLTEDTRLVLANAIHFKGYWLNVFDQHLTRQEYFTNFDGQRVRADFMVRRGDYAYFDENTFKALKLPYAGENFSMIILLPDTNVALPEFQKTLSAEVFGRTLENMNYRDVQVMIPRFRIETKSDLDLILAGMGMPEAFSQSADFSGMTGKRDLKIDKIVHQAAIEVGEQGTEAAAATAVVMVQKSLPVFDEEPPILFKTDRPFLFFIIENRTGSILFAGRQVRF